jgi:predicted DNA-binding transcriptional regulator YafY
MIGELDSNLKKSIKLKYLNYRGEISWRHVMPIEIRFGRSSWHNDDQWLLKGYDLEKNAEREFAMKDIQSWDFSASN